jgi:hypothetical protein
MTPEFQRGFVLIFFLLAAAFLVAGTLMINSEWKSAKEQASQLKLTVAPNKIETELKTSIPGIFVTSLGFLLALSLLIKVPLTVRNIAANATHNDSMMTFTLSRIPDFLITEKTVRVPFALALAVKVFPRLID